MKTSQKDLTPDLFPLLAAPQGFRYLEDFLSAEDEKDILECFKVLPFKSLKFHGMESKRRVVAYGLEYAFESKSLRVTQPVPEFLEPLTAKVAQWIHRPPGAFAEVLVTEYKPGVETGWHQDADPFGDVVGVSLLHPCIFQLRKISGKEAFRIVLKPRSVYLLSGKACDEWEHHITSVKDLRYSITFRTLRS